MKYLITGGAGFIGSNAAAYFLKEGHKVTILDNFSRYGSSINADWLKTIGGSLRVVKADVRYDPKILKEEVENSDQILHLAAQTSVTSSVENPRDDFEINALGTLNILEAVRLAKSKPALIYSSTNKVYGSLERLEVKEEKTRYVLADFSSGIDESFNLDFYSPYSCSKGSADQYVRDYARVYDVKATVFRQSCIYGPRQFGIEDQGWIAWFLIAALLKNPITIYGDGKQVRDLLYIDDLIRSFALAFDNFDKVRGEVFNIGGGAKNTVSIWREFYPLIKNLIGDVEVEYGDWRIGDQKVYVSDTRKIKKSINWSPQVSIEGGVRVLVEWIKNNKRFFKRK